MPETVMLHVGGCGVRVGSAFWGTIADDRPAVAAGVEVRESAHFWELSDGTLRPRAVFADLANGVADSAFASLVAEPCNGSRGSVAEGGGTSSCVWSRGHYDDGVAAADDVVELLRVEAERCDTLERLHVTHSAAGGTGGGFGTLLIKRAYDEAFGPRIVTTTVLPSPSSSASDSVLATYNTTFSLAQLMNNAAGSFVYQNDALWRDSDGGTYAAANATVAGDLAAFEGLDRYEPTPAAPGVLSGSFRGALFASVPFVRPHFFTTSRGFVSPAVGNVPASMMLGAPTAVAPAFVVLSGAAVGVEGADPAADVRFPRYMSVYGHRGGTLSAPCPPLPSSAAGAVGDHQRVRATAAFLGAPSTRRAFEEYLRDFKTLFAKKVFHHGFASVGLDSYEFEEAAATLQDLAWEMAQLAGEGVFESSFEDDDV